MRVRETRRAMWHLCRPGIRSAVWQILAVVLLTVVLWTASPNAPRFILAISYLLSGLGVRFTDTKDLELSADWIGRASRLMDPSEPRRATTVLLVQLYMVLVVIVVLTLAQIAETAVDTGGRYELDIWHFITPTALYSVGLAAFGTMARAARSAFRLNPDASSVKIWGE